FIDRGLMDNEACNAIVIDDDDEFVSPMRTSSDAECADLMEGMELRSRSTSTSPSFRKVENDEKRALEKRSNEKRKSPKRGSPTEKQSSPKSPKRGKSKSDKSSKRGKKRDLSPKRAEKKRKNDERALEQKIEDMFCDIHADKAMNPALRAYMLRQF